MMIVKFKSLNGTVYSIDADKWRISGSINLKIIEKTTDTYLLENTTGERMEIPISLIKVNKFCELDGYVYITRSLYEIWFLEKIRKEQMHRFAEFFNQHLASILKHKELVMSRPEYYLLKPPFFSSGSMYTGGFDYCLGALIDSFSTGMHAEITGSKNLFLISVQGSALSGMHRADIWDEEKGTITRRSQILPRPFITALKLFKKSLPETPRVDLDYQEKITKALIKEIKENEA